MKSPFDIKAGEPLTMTVLQKLKLKELKFMEFTVVGAGYVGLSLAVLISQRFKVTD